MIPKFAATAATALIAVLGPTSLGDGSQSVASRRSEAMHQARTEAQTTLPQETIIGGGVCIEKAPEGYIRECVREKTGAEVLSHPLFGGERP